MSFLHSGSCTDGRSKDVLYTADMEMLRQSQWFLPSNCSSLFVLCISTHWIKPVFPCSILISAPHQQQDVGFGVTLPFDLILYMPKQTVFDGNGISLTIWLKIVYSLSWKFGFFCAYVPFSFFFWKARVLISFCQTMRQIVQTYSKSFKVGDLMWLW